MSGTETRILRVVSLESRRASDMARLIERHGATPIVAPSMKEVPLQDQAEAAAFADVLGSGQCDVLVLLTGVGTRLLVDAMATRMPRDEVIALLRKVVLVCRGPKPVAVLKQLGLRPTAIAAEPNTWRQLLDVIDAEVPVQGQRVTVQEYGQPNPDLIRGLRDRGAAVRAVPIYGWTMPDDTGPLRDAIALICEGEADALMVTSRQQIENLLTVARGLNREDALLAALAQDVLVVSVGPITSETLELNGIVPDLHPAHPKMGHMAIAVAAEGWRLLDEKRKRGETPSP